MLITRAYITGEYQDGRGWPVWIPLLYGMPDEDYRPQTTDSNVDKTTGNLSAEVLRESVITKTENAKKPQTNNIASVKFSDSIYSNIKEFITYANICTWPGLNVSFTVGDVVYVMFENNDLAYPVILGVMGSAVCGGNITKLSVQSLAVSEKSQLTPSISSDTLADLIKAVQPILNVFSPEVLTFTESLIKTTLSTSDDEVKTDQDSV